MIKFLVKPSIVFIGAFFCFTQTVKARVFDMSETKFGGYFNATYATSNVDKDYFTGESSSTAFSKGFATDTGGEFGFIYNTDKFSWVFGIEVMKPTKTSGTATTGSSVDYFYTSELSAFVPKFGIELVFYQGKDYRIFANGAMGTASLTTKTQYSTLTIAPNSDFSIEGKGTANLLNYSIGGEIHWTDNTTVSLAYGYRQLNFKKIKYLKDVTTSFTGAHSKGDKILKADGSELGYDFSNYYLAVGLRFWLH